MKANPLRILFYFIFRFTEVKVCHALSNPFQEYPVDSFLPPEGAAVDELVTWKNAVKEMMKKLASVRVGGSLLRDFIQRESKPLEELRIKLFCPYVVDQS